jgi:hypothetical protein
VILPALLQVLQNAQVVLPLRAGHLHEKREFRVRQYRTRCVIRYGTTPRRDKLKRLTNTTSNGHQIE